MKKNSIQKKLLKIFLVCMLVFGVLFLAVGIYEDYVSEQELSRQYLLQGAKLAAEVMQTASVEEMLADSSNEAYEKQIKQINKICEELRLEYIYSFVPSKDGQSFEMVTIAGMEQVEINNSGQLVNHKVDKEILEIYEGKRQNYYNVTNGKYRYVITAYCPVYDAQGNVQAVMGADLQSKVIVSRFLQNVKWTCALLVLQLVLALTLILYLCRRFVISPVLELSVHMENFVQHRERQGDFSRIEVKSNDEIGKMAEAFNQMAQDIEYYVKYTADMAAEAEKEKTEREAARRIQKDILPQGRNPYPENKSFSLWAEMKAAQLVGGDFYDIFWISKKKICVVIGDVSGKGIAAAMFMMRAMTLIKERASQYKTLSQVLETVNNDLCERNEEGMFVTLFIGVLDTENGQFRYANAGHNPPCICRQEFDFLEIAKAVPLGLFADEAYKEERMQFSPGNAIFMYTDGVSEAVSGNEKLFGTERMLQILNQCKKEDCETIIQAMQHGISEFTGDMEQSDDVTMLLLRWGGMQ